MVAAFQTVLRFLYHKWLTAHKTAQKTNRETDAKSLTTTLIIQAIRPDLPPMSALHLEEFRLHLSCHVDGNMQHLQLEKLEMLQVQIPCSSKFLDMSCNIMV